MQRARFARLGGSVPPADFADCLVDSPITPLHCAQDTVVAVRRGGDQLVVSNLDGGAYPEAVFSTDPGQVRVEGRGLPALNPVTRSSSS